jgi:copper chaperone CopZ
LVKLALERSEGVTDFKLGLASAKVKFDTEKIDEETIIKNVKKMTRYDTVTVKEEMPEEMMKEE